jgi:hypothetical protein
MQWNSSFGSSKKDYDYTVNWIANWGADLVLFYPSHFKIGCSPDKPSIITTILRQIGEFETGEEAFADKKQYLINFTKQIPSNSIDFDEKNPTKREINWRVFWLKMKEYAPELGSVAICLLSLGISEACAERSFSIQKLTHSHIRNRLNEDIVEAEMIIRYNKYVITGADQYSEVSDSE